jgi:hypothetical protein
MTNQHPITPPPELRRQWLDNDDFPFVAGTNDLLSIAKDRLNSVMDQAAQWGADQELEACVKWIEDRGIDGVFIYDEDAGNYILSEDFRAARRPKPSRLKEEVSQIIDCLIEGDCLNDDDAVTLLRVLEAFND